MHYLRPPTGETGFYLGKRRGRGCGQIPGFPPAVFPAETRPLREPGGSGDRLGRTTGSRLEAARLCRTQRKSVVRVPWAPRLRSKGQEREPCS